MSNLLKKFPLTSDECELLLEFANVKNLQELAAKMGRDHSVVARMLKRISDKYPVVEKKAGKWVLTDMGRKVNECTDLAISQQAGALSTQTVLRIGASREFSARIIGKAFQEFQSMFENTEIVVNCYERGVEPALLSGFVDIGFDCDRPYDPEVAYKLVVDEPIVVVASKAFAKLHKTKIAAGEYYKLPHLLCDRLSPDKRLLKSENQVVVAARFNDIATTRAACLQGAGWALLPRYAVAQELEDESLMQIHKTEFGKSRYGVWWLRRQSHLKPFADKMTKWLETVEL